MPPPKNNDTYTQMLEWIEFGSHAFIACDNPQAIQANAKQLATDLHDWPVSILSISTDDTAQDFRENLEDACQLLLDPLGFKLSRHDEWIHPLLSETARILQQDGKRSMLVITRFDNLLKLQNTMEYEGAFRGVMERYLSLTIVICGPKKSILSMMTNDRPFFRSHRIFYLDDQ